MTAERFALLVAWLIWSSVWGYAVAVGSSEARALGGLCLIWGIAVVALYWNEYAPTPKRTHDELMRDDSPLHGVQKNPQTGEWERY